MHSCIFWRRPVTFGGGDADAHGAANYAWLHNSGAVRPWQVIPWMGSGGVETDFGALPRTLYRKAA